MTKEEFETIIKPLMLLDGKNCQFMRSALLGNFKKWKETEQLLIHGVSNRRELLIDFYSNQLGGINDVNKCAIYREVENYLSINCA